MENKKKTGNTKYPVMAGLFIILVIAVCILLCAKYVQNALLEANENSALNSALLIKNNFELSDSEVTYMKGLTFNEMEQDPINRRLAAAATGTSLTEPIISVYLAAPLAEEEVKYKTDESNADFWNVDAGTPLDAIWLLNMAVDGEGNAVFVEREDIYRYTITTNELQKVFSERVPYSTHTRDEWGEVITGYVPFFTTEGSFAGMLGVDFDVAKYQQGINRAILVMLCIMGASLILFSLLFLWVYRNYSMEQQKNTRILQEEKNKLSEILNHIAVGVYVYHFIEDKVSIITANSYIVNMLGRNPESLKKANSSNIMKYVHPDDRETVREMISRIKVPGSEVTREFRLQNGNTGKYIWVLARGTSTAKPDGSTVAYICYVDDTERKNLQGIENALQVEKEANKAKTDFLSNMSHDMRTPMNGILGLVTLMQDLDLPKEAQESLKQIQMSGKYLLNLINDTLDMNRIEENRMELHPVVSDAFRLTDNIRVNAEIMSADKGVQFTLKEINPGKITHTVLYVDESRIEQIFMNLISNAVKFTPSGGAVCVTIERLETTETYIRNRYQVIDTGIGMSQEFLQHLFEPFTQEGRIATDRESGTGLGMSIVHRLVKMMGGELTVESRLNAGTTFTLLMQFDRYQGNVEPETPVTRKKVQLEGRRILLCEDHPLNRQIAVRLLQKKGMEVETAENGREGTEKFEKSEPGYYDLILMDIRMPVMDGITASRMIRGMERKDAKTIPIVAMTANAFDEDVQNCRKAGMNDHIAKPLDIDRMYRVLEEQIFDRQ